MNRTTTITGDLGELTFETEMFELPDGPKPDKNWRYIDHNGHEHRYSEVEGVPRYPTLKTVEDEPYWCADCDEEHVDAHLECAICDEVIEPGTVGPSGFREFAPGGKSAFLNGEPISGELAEEILTAYREQAAEARREQRAKTLTGLTTEELQAELRRRGDPS